MRRTRTVYLFIVSIIALVLSACTAPETIDQAPAESPETTAETSPAPTPEPTPSFAPEPTEEPAAESQASACMQVFAQAAQTQEMQDTVEDLDPALRTCTSIEEWLAANEAYPEAISKSLPVDPIEFLINRCLYADDADTPLCAEVREQYPDRFS